jgi:hypothetical protein
MCACRKPMTRFDMVGNYVADYPFAKENLTLFRDASFTQQVIIKATSQIYSANGSWSFYESQSRIDFTKEFMNVLDGFGNGRNPPVAGGASLPVTRPFGTVRISEYPVAVYKKQKQPVPK